jgi:glycine C-acetyltransferase
LFETLLSDKDAVISDELNHASIIDGIRLCKAQRFRIKHNDMADLEAQLRAAKDARFRLVATDGCFSMDGTIANLDAICDLAEKCNALTMTTTRTPPVFLAKPGGHARVSRCDGRIDIITRHSAKRSGARAAVQCA